MLALVRPLISNPVCRWLSQTAVAGLTLCLFAVSLAGGSAAHAQGSPASRRVYRSELQLLPSNLIFAKVKINGREALALIDSGSARAIELSPRLARELNIALTEDQTRRFKGHDGKPFYAKNGVINSLVIGDYEAGNRNVEVIEGHIESITGQVKTDFDVILGWEFLSQSYLVVDYKHLSLMFSDSPIDLGRSQISIKYDVVNYVPIVRGLFSEDEVRLLFDTGAPTCAIDAGYAKAQAGEKVTEQLSLAGSKISVECRVKDLSVIGSSLGCVGVIGNNLLKAYAVYVDHQNRIIHLH
jgi:hypothetical protein